VTEDFFPLLYARPFRGRFFVAEEYTAPGSQVLGSIPRPELEGTTDGGVVILGYGLWRRRFGESASAIGQMISLNGRRAMIVGVLPPDFAFTKEPPRKRRKHSGRDPGWIPPREELLRDDIVRNRGQSVIVPKNPGASHLEAVRALPKAGFGCLRHGNTSLCPTVFVSLPSASQPRVPK